jgi:hypothetical protein
MRLLEIFNEVQNQQILLEKKKGKFKIQTLADFLKDEGVKPAAGGKLDEAKLGQDVPAKVYDKDALVKNLRTSES